MQPATTILWYKDALLSSSPSPTPLIKLVCPDTQPCFGIHTPKSIQKRIQQNMSPPTNGVNGHSQTTGDQYAGKPPNWEPLLQQAAFTPTRKLRVVCVGAGMSGMMVAWYVYHGMKLQGEIDLAIYDRNPDIGGTWLENT